MAEKLLRVFVHGIEAFQTHLSPGDEIVANGADIAIIQPGEKTPFQTTAATAEAERGVKLGKDAGEVTTVDKRGAKRKAAAVTKKAPAKKAPAKKTAARKRSSAKS